MVNINRDSGPNNPERDQGSPTGVKFTNSPRSHGSNLDFTVGGLATSPTALYCDDRAGPVSLFSYSALISQISSARAPISIEK